MIFGAFPVLINRAATVNSGGEIRLYEVDAMLWGCRQPTDREPYCFSER